MSATPKSRGAAAAVGVQMDNFLADYTKGIEGLAAMGRQAFDAAAQQNREWAGAWKKSVELAVEGFQQAAQAHLDLLDVAVERGAVVSRLATENAESVSKTAAGATAVFETLVDHATAAQKRAVDSATAQGTSAYAAAKRQFETSGTAAAETFQRSVDTLIETQRILRARDAA